MPRRETGADDHAQFSASQAIYRFSRFSKQYRARLLGGIQDVQRFCLHEGGGVRLKALLTNPRLADRLLAQYVIHRHLDNRGATLSLVKHGLLLVPQLRGRLATAWENLRVWEEKRKAKLRPPVPVPIWVFMTGLARGHAAVAGSQKRQQEWRLVALMLELGLLCLLRPGELLRLRGADFALPGDFSLSQSHAAIRIVSPKNRRQFGDEQFVALQNPNTIAWLRDAGVMGKDEPLWSSTASRFAKLFKQLTIELGVDDCNFTPASLRPGGATMLYGRGMNISQLRFAGRWTAEKSLEHYIQQAMATQILNKLEPHVVGRLPKLAPWCLRLVMHPSTTHLCAFLPKVESGNGMSVVQWSTSYAELACTAWKSVGESRATSRHSL